MCSSLYKSLIIVTVALLGATAGLPVHAETQSVTFSYSDENFPNPERGIFHHIEVSPSNKYPFSTSSMSTWRDNGISLAFVCFRLDDFVNSSAISDSFLEVIKGNLALLRTGGIKAVVRFCYSYDQYASPRDASIANTHAHIAQLKPILQEYYDVIALLEAGFIGAWGEWYYTDNFGFEPSTYDDYSSRRALAAKLLDAMPSNRCVSVRYPAAKLGVLQKTVADTLSFSDAFSGSDISRLGFHNDCFLAAADDYGTYNAAFGGSSYTDMRQYLSYETRYLPMGGETCTETNEYTSQANALADFSAFHWSYLNEDYHTSIISYWDNIGFLYTIRRLLGYRFALEGATYTSDAAAGKAFKIVFKVNNHGWATPYNPRPVKLVMINTSNTSQRYEYTLDTDPRRWTAGYISTVTSTITLDSAMPTGSYHIYLWLPDESSSLASRSEYAIRMANTDVWNESLGMNYLADVTLTSDGSGADNNDDYTIDDSNANTIWTGSVTFDSSWSTTTDADARFLAASYFTTCSVGDKLQIYFTQYGGGDPVCQLYAPDWKSAYATSSGLSSSDSYAEFELDATLLANLQANGCYLTGANATVTRVDLIKYSNDVLWTGSCTYDSSWSTTDAPPVIEASFFKNASVGDQLVIDFTKADGWATVQLWDPSITTCYVANSDGLDSDATSLSITLTASLLAQLQSTGCVLTGFNVTITKVSLVSQATSGDTTSTAFTTTNSYPDYTGVYTLSGVRVADELTRDHLPAGIYIMHGKKILIP